MATSSYIIGFSNKMYTLWSMHQETKSLYAGYNQQEQVKVWKAEYIKNISKDLDTVKMLYPDVEINLSLKGTHFEWSEKKVKEEIPNDAFQFGKYKSKKIMECEDLSYLEWYLDNCSIDGTKEIIEQRIVEIHTQNNDILFHNVWYTTESYNEMLEKNKMFLNIREKLTKLESFDVVMTKNFSVSSDDYDFNEHCYNQSTNFLYFENDNNLAIRLDFVLEKGNFDVREYHGFEYALPTLKGKAKMIKNKVMRITDYDVEFDAEYFWTAKINIKGFEMVKK